MLTCKQTLTVDGHRCGVRVEWVAIPGGPAHDLTPEQQAHPGWRHVLRAFDEFHHPAVVWPDLPDLYPEAVPHG